MHNKEVIIFISSPNAYADVFQVFIECLKMNWSDCPYEIILSTNNQEYEGITVINNHTNGDGWMDRAIPVIKMIENPYIFLLCDDCLISKKVDNRKVMSVINDIEKYGLDFCGVANNINGDPLYRGSLINRVKMNKPYALNLQAGIYNREFLLELLGDGNETPWELENKWLKMASKSKNICFPNIGSCNEDIFGCKNGVLKGKWFWSAVHGLKKAGISVNANRSVMTLLEEIRIVSISRLGKIIPSSMRPIIKKTMALFGKKFASEN